MNASPSKNNKTHTPPVTRTVYFLQARKTVSITEEEKFKFNVSMIAGVLLTNKETQQEKMKRYNLQ